MKKITYVFLILIFCFSFNVYASTNVEERSENDLKIHESIVVNDENIDNILNTPIIDEKEKIYDFADLFTSEQEKGIYFKIESFIDSSNYDLAVVTINENNKADEVEYADDFYDYNYFGFDSSFSGLLILIDMDNRVIYVSTTGYAIAMYDDYRIDQIIDRGYNDLASGQYSACIIKMIEELERYYDLGFPSNNDDLVIDGDDVYYDDSRSLSDNLKYSAIGAVIITIIVSVIMYNKTRLKIKVNNVVSYLVSENNIQIKKNFLRSSVSRVPRNTGTSGGSGRSSGGGSSFHSSSSGRSHGGGGRSF